ncbi:restriction endonuclease [Brevibacillus reuszeri]|uniref:restriction endonuclease n=1 Tax=Brevibacillus reuszeri TaxID=54915 RepID=UPI000CCC5B06|nr:restriction endonuclease [Brevibacillus reuszeri]
MDYYLIGISVLIIIFVLIGILLRIKRSSPVTPFQFSNFDDIKNIGIEDIDKMQDGIDFEIYLQRLLIELGYHDAYKTVNSRDFGADVVFTDSSGDRAIIQAKRYDTNYQIGLDAVQQVYTAKNFYRAKKTLVITSTTYTDSSETLAGVNGVLLLDRSDLIEIITNYQEGRVERAKSIIEREPRVIYAHFEEDASILIKKDIRL